MRIAILSTIARSTSPIHHSQKELAASLLTEELVRRGHDVTLFATADTITKATLDAVCPRGLEEDCLLDTRVWESLHIANCFEKADRFDIIHNHCGYTALPYAGLVNTPVLTTMYESSGLRLLPVFKRFDTTCHYVSLNNANRFQILHYIDTVYQGVAVDEYHFRKSPGDYLLYIASRQNDNGVDEAIEIARKAQRRLVLAAAFQGSSCFDMCIKSHRTKNGVCYLSDIGPLQWKALLGGACALLRPVNCHESGELSIVESMACGTPVIACVQDGSHEIITDGVDGFLVRSLPAAIDAVAKISSIRRRTCRETVERRFTDMIMTDCYLDVYKKILDKTTVRA